jgi:hypothetical protein
MSSEQLRVWTQENESLREQQRSHPSFVSAESLVRENYLKYQRFPGARELALRQMWENQEFQRNLEAQISAGTRESLDKEAVVHQAKKTLYEKLWISDTLSNNNWLQNFSKWIIDTLIFDNIELAVKVWETGGKILIDALKQLASWEWIKQISQSLGENITHIFTGNAYEKWKSAAELWLIWSGLTAGVALWRKWIKLWMKELSRLWVNKEHIVRSAEVKGTIRETRSKIDGIVPKKQIDFEKALLEDIAKLGNAERKEAAKFYLKRELPPHQQDAIIKAHEVGSTRAWAWIHNYSQKELLEKIRILEQAGFSKEERRVLLEKGVCGKIPISEEELTKIVANIERQVKWLEKLWIPESLSKDLLESWLLNTQFFWWDLLKRFEDLNKKWVDYNTMVDEAIKKIPHLTREEALLIFSYTDEIIYRRFNALLRWQKEVLDTLTPHNIEVSKKLSLKLEQALQKMPNLKAWEDWFILRWDKSSYWNWKIWDEVNLSSFTSVSNNKKDIFLWGSFRNDTQVSIIWKEWRVKDISELSIAVKFWVSEEELKTLTDFSGKLKKLPKTNNEWVILPNSRVVITDRFKLEDINYIDAIQTR